MLLSYSQGRRIVRLSRDERSSLVWRSHNFFSSRFTGWSSRRRGRVFWRCPWTTSLYTSSSLTSNSPALTSSTTLSSALPFSTIVSYLIQFMYHVKIYYDHTCWVFPSLSHFHPSDIFVGRKNDSEKHFNLLQLSSFNSPALMSNRTFSSALPYSVYVLCGLYYESMIIHEYFSVWVAFALV